jgi:hypothetical protein
VGNRERNVLEIILPSALDDEVAGRMNRGGSVFHKAFTSNCYQEIVPGGLSRRQ